MNIKVSVDDGGFQNINAMVDCGWMICRQVGDVEMCPGGAGQADGGEAAVTCILFLFLDHNQPLRLIKEFPLVISTFHSAWVDSQHVVWLPPAPAPAPAPAPGQ